MVCSQFIGADLAIYANVNYVSMDGGYKSYATGMVHYKSLRWAAAGSEQRYYLVLLRCTVRIPANKANDQE